MEADEREAGRASALAGDRHDEERIPARAEAVVEDHVVPRAVRFRTPEDRERVEVRDEAGQEHERPVAALERKALGERPGQERVGEGLHGEGSIATSSELGAWTQPVTLDVQLVLASRI